MIVHDYLTQRGGAERVVLSMLKAWPDAPLYTSLYDPDGTFPEFAKKDVRVLPLNRVALLRRHHRLALPFLAPAFSRLGIVADVVVCSSSGWAHGTRVHGKKLVYCYTPARWLYQPEKYLGPRSKLKKMGLQLIAQPLRNWDRKAAESADCYLAISTIVQERIYDCYGIAAEIMTPANTFDPGLPTAAVEGITGPFYLCVSRLLPYKNVECIVEAFRGGDSQRLVVVGIGPERAHLESIAPANVYFVGQVSHQQLSWLYGNCEALIAASYEDLGLTPIEAAAFGKPSAVLRWGGYLDTVKEGVTGVFFDKPDPAQIAASVEKLRARPLNRNDILRHAERFNEANFIERMRTQVLKILLDD